jgi:hypothetical protein
MKRPISSLLNIAETHVRRLRYAMSQLKNKVPVSRDTIANMTDEEMPIFELYISRFAKLQDFMGATLFDAVLEAGGEQIDRMTFIDKLHKLEKLELIPDATKWKDMRDLRNHLAHEYPEYPEMTAKFFNQAYDSAPFLLVCLDNISRFLKR